MFTPGELAEIKLALRLRQIQLAKEARHYRALRDYTEVADRIEDRARAIGNLIAKVEAELATQPQP